MSTSGKISFCKGCHTRDVPLALQVHGRDKAVSKKIDEVIRSCSLTKGSFTITFNDTTKTCALLGHISTWSQHHCNSSGEGCRNSLLDRIVCCYMCCCTVQERSCCNSFLTPLVSCCMYCCSWVTFTSSETTEASTSTATPPPTRFPAHALPR